MMKINLNLNVVRPRVQTFSKKRRFFYLTKISPGNRDVISSVNISDFFYTIYTKNIFKKSQGLLHLILNEKTHTIIVYRRNDWNGKGL